MKRYVIFLICSILFCFRAHGQAQIEYTINFSSIYDLTLTSNSIVPSGGGVVSISFNGVRDAIQIHYEMSEDVAFANRNQQLQLNFESARYDQSDRKGFASFYISPNQSINTHVYIFRAGSKVATVTQYGNSQPQPDDVFNLIDTSPVSIVPGEFVTFTLDGSNEGVAYNLIQNGDMTADTVIGTGESITFYGPYDAGLYTVVNEYNVEMNGSKDVTFYNCVTDCLLEISDRQLNGDGENCSFIITHEDPAVIREIVTVIEKINALYSTIFPNISISAPSFDSHTATIQISCGPNLSGSSIYYDTWIRSSRSNPGKTFTITQARGSLKNFTLSGSFDGYRQSYNRMYIANSQNQVAYTLYCDGQPVENKFGTGGEISFGQISTPGTYTLKATYQGNTLQMTGSLTQNIALITTGSTNWMLEKTFTQPAGRGELHDITYYNGLGLPSQKIGVGASPSGYNIVNPIYYDPLLRDDSRTYHPFTSTKQTAECEDAPYASSNYTVNYGATEAAYAFGKQEYESSPLNRPIRSYKPGIAFQGASEHYTSYSYPGNQSNEVRKLTSSGGTFTVGGYYAQGTLTVETATDEDGAIRKTYKNHQGKTVLERVEGGSETHDTYYVFDIHENTVFVISPKGSAQLQNTNYSWDADLTKKYCYCYTYDSRGNVLSKQSPGRKPQYYSYDIGNRVVLYYDGNMKNDQRIIYEYDVFGREIKRSLLTGTAVQQSMTLGASPQLYSLPSTLLIENKYGTRETGELAFVAQPNYAESSDVVQKPTGLNSYQQLAVLDETGAVNRYIQQAFFYDYRGQIIQRVETDPQGETLRVSTKYDFSGRPIRQKETYGSDSIVKTFLYDIRGRLTTQTARLNDGEPAIVAYNYDELGRVTKNRYGNQKNVLEENLEYNVQNWLTAKSNDFFEMQLAYYDPKLGTQPSYTGNISEWAWKNKNAGQSNTNASNIYAFQYDLFARLKEANLYIGSTLSNANTEKGIQYDRNSNMTAISRTAAGSPQQNYTLGYNGNKLSSLNGQANTYIYDDNGNCTYDGRLNLGFSYNMLNLPTIVEDGGGVAAVYQYIADGRKITNTDANGRGYLYKGSLVYRLSNSSNTLESAEFAAGRIYKALQGIEIAYHLTDHLGSVRATVNQNRQVANRSDYYPFGLRYSSDGAATTNRYLYSGKELQMLGGADYLDYGARRYDPVIPHWDRPDPLEAKYPGIGQYVFCAGNPVRFIDIEGKLIGDPVKNPEIRWNRASNLYGEKIRRNGGVLTNHQGFDYYAPVGTEVMSVRDGVVVQSGDAGIDYGTAVTIEHTDDDGNVVYSFYAHLSEANAQKGSTVKEGEVIGKSGISGNAKNMKGKDQHLHFELRTQKESKKGLTGKKNPNEIVDTKFVSQDPSKKPQTGVLVIKIDKKIELKKYIINP